MLAPTKISQRHAFLYPRSAEKPARFTRPISNFTSIRASIHLGRTPHATCRPSVTDLRRLRPSAVDFYVVRASTKSITTVDDPLQLAKSRVAQTRLDFQSALTDLGRSRDAERRIELLASMQQHVEALSHLVDAAEPIYTEKGHAFALRFEGFMTRILNLVERGAGQARISFAQVSFNMTTLNGIVHDLGDQIRDDVLMPIFEKHFPKESKEIGFLTNRGGDLYLVDIKDSIESNFSSRLEQARKECETAANRYLQEYFEANAPTPTQSSTRVEVLSEYTSTHDYQIKKNAGKRLRKDRKEPNGGRRAYYNKAKIFVRHILFGELISTRELKDLGFTSIQTPEEPRVQIDPGHPKSLPKQIPDLKLDSQEYHLGDRSDEQQIRIHNNTGQVRRLIQALKSQLEVMAAHHDPFDRSDLVVTRSLLRSIREWETGCYSTLQTLCLLATRDPRSPHLYKKEYFHLAIQELHQALKPKQRESGVTILYFDIDHLYAYFKAHPPKATDPDYWALIQAFLKCHPHAKVSIAGGDEILVAIPAGDEEKVLQSIHQHINQNHNLSRVVPLFGKFLQENGVTIRGELYRIEGYDLPAGSYDQLVAELIKIHGEDEYRRRQQEFKIVRCKGRLGLTGAMHRSLPWDLSKTQVAAIAHHLDQIVVAKKEDGRRGHVFNHDGSAVTRS